MTSQGKPYVVDLTRDDTIVLDDSVIEQQHEESSDSEPIEDYKIEEANNRLESKSEEPVEELNLQENERLLSPPRDDIIDVFSDTDSLFGQPSSDDPTTQSSIRSLTPTNEDSNTNHSTSRKSSTPTNKQMRARAREEAKRLKAIEKEKERLEKAANRANAANKALENCTAILDKNVINLINDPEEIAIKTLFDESCINYQLTDISKYENSITWSFKRTEVEGGKCVVTYRTSDWIIVVMSGDDYLRRILLYRDDSEHSDSLDKYICDIRRRSGMDVILFVFSLAIHLKNAKQKDAKEYQKKFKNRFEGRQGASTSSKTTSNVDEPTADATSGGTLNIGTTDLQDLRLMLEVDLKYKNPEWKFHFEFYEKTQDAVQSLARYTSSIAKFEISRKTKAVTNLDWAINMDKERAIDPTKSPSDLTKLWITQLQQFSNIGLPMAKAIAAEYPSPGALLDQYKNLTVEEGEELLSGLSVQRNLRRQVGSIISRKIHCFMTSRDPDKHIGYN